MIDFTYVHSKVRLNLREKYPVLCNIVNDIMENEGLGEELLLVHASLVYEYLHLVFISTKMLNASIILPVEDLYETLPDEAQDLGHEFSSLSQNPLVIMTQATALLPLN
jgi:hypothetical protein